MELSSQKVKPLTCPADTKTYLQSAHALRQCFDKVFVASAPFPEIGSRCKLFLDIPVDERIIFIVIGEHLLNVEINNHRDHNTHEYVSIMVLEIIQCIE